MTGSTAAVLASRTRQRREARIRENYDRIFASLVNPDSAKFAARHPSRVIPDVPGIIGLSKTEIKKDTKEIDKQSTFSRTPEFQDEEEIQRRVLTSFRPGITADSTLVKKQQRLHRWCKIEDTNLIQQEIQTLKVQVQSSRQKLSVLEEKHLEIEETLEISRKYLSEMLDFLQAQSASLRQQLKGVIEQLILECNVSLPSQYNPFAIDWTTIIQDFFSRLLQQTQLQKELSVLVQQQLVNYNSSIVNSLPSNGVKGGALVSNQIQIEISDLQSYPGFASALFTSTDAINVKMETSDIKKAVEKGTEEEDDEDEEKERLLKLFQALQVAMSRDEELIDDLELFLQDFSNAAASSATTTTSSTISLELSTVSKDPLQSSSQFLLESMTLHNSELLNLQPATPHPSVKVEVKQEPAGEKERKESEPAKLLAVNPIEIFLPLLKDTAVANLPDEQMQARKNIKTLLNHHYQLLLNHLDPNSAINVGNNAGTAAASNNSNSLMTRKRRNPANKLVAEIIQGRTTIRSRMERDVPILFSPVSIYEDSYIGTIPARTIYTSSKAAQQQTNIAKVIDNDINTCHHDHYYVHSFLPSSLREVEADVLNGLDFQAAIAVSSFEQKKLQLNQEDLEKSIQEAQASLQKTEHFYKQVIIEDYHERNRMKAALVQFGLLPSTAGGAAPGPGSGGVGAGCTTTSQQQQDLLEGMEGLESLSQMLTNSAGGIDGGVALNGNNAIGPTVSSVELSKTLVPQQPVKYKRGTYPRNKNNGNTAVSTSTPALTEEITAEVAILPQPESVGGSSSSNKRKQTAIGTATSAIASQNNNNSILVLSQQSDVSVATDSVSNNPTKRRRSNEK